ncbi:four-carbon acid sugar kinase family protein [Halegenticoccus tardaugens]|uniref:four-carbon acid sugar kinase family protein n=1 Tax=Halegenticoccus tardaugens TaxID=2071624 RepID=UPI00100BB414|nr:four-carbon acid sugar kinase family protein [Halegenticoccus tardaugens]
MDGLLLAYYGDDFTGSTDVLESLSLNGVPTILFLETPDARDLERFGNVRAVGIAGTSRSMSPEEMEASLSSAFEVLDALGPEIVQYKVCSTFDSSPEVGSIGRAIDVGQRTFDSPFVPVVVATPSLEPRGRYVVFGNLFATVEGTNYRLDRHPTMSRHPVTPMTEADLTLHLGEQTDREIGLLDVRHIDENDGTTLDRTLDAVAASNEIVVFDGLDREHQQKVARLIWERCENRGDDPLFSASSSGLNYALSRYWRSAGVVSASEQPRSVEAVEQILVMSGSASPVNCDQIDWALDNGFEGIRLDAPRLVDPDTAEAARKEAIDTALRVLEEGGSPLLYSVRGPDDNAVERTIERATELSLDETRVGPRLGDEQGRITRGILDTAPVERVCVAGGDTSGNVAPHLDVFALEFLAPVGAGSPLCRAASRTAAFDGLQVALKGGQVQTAHEGADFFGVVRDGGILP